MYRCKYFTIFTLSICITLSGIAQNRTMVKSVPQPIHNIVLVHGAGRMVQAGRASPTFS